MTYEQFLLILDNYKAYCEVISDAYDVGIDLLEGKFATNSYVEKMLKLSITSHYGEMGWDWVSWFIYENDYGQKGLEAWDGLDGDLICQTHKELHEYLETNHNLKRITRNNMKTPMQEAYNRLDEMSNKYLDEYNRLSSPYTDGVATGIDYAMQIIESLIEKEKEVIQRAYKQGVIDEIGDIIDLRTITEAEEYYNRIFNTKEK